MSKQTKNIDICECVYCGHKWDGKEACNGDMDESVITCTECGKQMNVYLSIEYLCVELD